MSKIILTYVGKDSWSSPTFKVGDTGYYVKDVNLANNKENLCLHWSSPKDDIDGEPDYPFKPKEGVEVEIVGFNPITKEDKFNYMMLSRLQSDCEAHLGISNYKIVDVENHIRAMKDLWYGFEEKPEWLTIEQIEEYEKEMKQ